MCVLSNTQVPILAVQLSLQTPDYFLTFGR